MPSRAFTMYNEMTKIKPFRIALWDGITIGGGAIMSAHSDIRIATENSMYTMPEATIGFSGDPLTSSYLTRLKENDALGYYIDLCGHRIKGKELVSWGIATHFVPHARIERLKQHLITSVNKDTSDKAIEGIVNNYADKDAEHFPIKDYDQIMQTFKDDGTIQDIFRRLEASDSDFAKETLKLLSKPSPFSLCVIYEMNKRAKDMTFE